ncbi:protein SHI RELATED SEQUENCE 1-like [Juglans microcarpa x Juglans regia]|uniref:protein SHI RELATED SEQUENCE 1-like n=1 Tax=Juglans microcarpa x Juglans regia TaxID=2249226 RepID=UPI001B7F3CCC|nr:protein SHI RELATED SEQUENCE 1-like [Juglans microcarpa x Juglans regia]
MMLMQGGIGGSFTSSRCQDCGNQAKKECVYLRCRTCCRNKGFQCQTHVKSTWIPLYRRRQRQQQLAAAVLPQHLRVRGHPERQSQITSSGSEEANFPAEVHLRAAFFCIRLGSVNDAAEDQYAYQTAVSIGGHLFKGILYDQGPDHESNCTPGEGSSLAPQPPKLLNAADLANVTTNPAYTETLHPPLFPFPFTTPFMPGTQFLQRPKS